MTVSKLENGFDVFKILCIYRFIYALMYCLINFTKCLRKSNSVNV